MYLATPLVNFKQLHYQGKVSQLQDDTRKSLALSVKYSPHTHPLCELFLHPRHKFPLHSYRYKEKSKKRQQQYQY